MIPIREAACPRCFATTDVAYPLKHEAASNTYVCSKAPDHKFKEDERGFLKSTNLLR